MTYLALYRAWRPRKFHDIIGQDHITRTLVNALTRSKLSHAYLFCGPRGTGKTSAAKILARAVNCESPSRGEPCGECPSCLEILSGRGVDVLEIDAASNRGIDEIRDLRDKVRYAPARLQVKVYIIDEVHMLTAEAFNALLKTLEEPPTRVLFVLATTEPHRLPATILSRCQRFDFFPLEVQAIASYLAMVAGKEGRQASSEALLALARTAGGGMRDALSLLEQALAFSEDELQEEDVLQVLGQAGWHHFLSLAERTAAADVNACLNIVDAVVREGKDLTQFARDLLAFFRDLALAGMASEDNPLLAGYTKERQRALKETAGLFSPEGLVEIIEEVNAIIADMKWSEQPRLILEVGFFRLCHLPPRLTLGEAIKRIGALEDKLAGLAAAPQPAAGSGEKPMAAGGLKKESKGKIEKGKEAGSLQAPLAAEGLKEVPPGETGETGEGARHLSLEESTRAWRDVLKKVQKEKPMLYSLVKDSYVLKVHKSLLVVAFRKNSEFCCGMLERRRADKTFLEFLLTKLLEQDVSLKVSKEDGEDGEDGEMEGAAGEVSRANKKRPPEEPPSPPPGEEPPPLPPGEEPGDGRGPESEDLLVESARDIFNGNIIE